MRTKLLVILLALAAAAHADTWNQRYAVTGEPRLYIKAGDGNIRVSSSDATEIVVRVTTVGYRLAPDDVTIDESQSGSEVRVVLRLPHWDGVGTGWRSRRIDVDVTVPRHATLDLNTSDGNIVASRLNGDMRFHTGDGNMDLQDLDGSLVASSGDGNMRVAGRFDGLDLQSGDGRIDAAVSRGSRISSTWRLRSGDGNVTLRLAEDIGADLDASTGDGSVNVDFPITTQGRIRESRIHGRLNGGGGILEVHTGDGSIHVSRL